MDKTTLSLYQLGPVEGGAECLPEALLRSVSSNRPGTLESGYEKPVSGDCRALMDWCK